MFEVTIEETFAAGHALRNYKGKCENVHGHNYRCQVTLEGAELDSIGLLVDFVELKKVVHGVLERMDLQWLNEVPPVALPHRWRCVVVPDRAACTSRCVGVERRVGREV